METNNLNDQQLEQVNGGVYCPAQSGVVESREQVVFIFKKGESFEILLFYIHQYCYCGTLSRVLTSSVNDYTHDGKPFHDFGNGLYSNVTSG